jgi:hypothetical protein
VLDVRHFSSGLPGVLPRPGGDSSSEARIIESAYGERVRRAGGDNNCGHYRAIMLQNPIKN